MAADPHVFAGASLPPAPPAPLGADGRLATGTYVGRVADIDWSAAARGPAWRRRTWKRWHYVSLTGPELVLAVAVVDLGWAGTAFAYLFDRAGRRMATDLEVVAPPGRADVAPVPGQAVATGFSSRRLHVRLAADGGGRWRLEARSPQLTVDATLRETAAGPTLCAIAPVPGGVGDCTHKTPAIEVEGLATARGARFELDGAVAALDHTSGILARRTRWRWASATDRRVALNLTEDFTAPYENALWVDGELRRLGPVRFVLDPRRPEEPWRISAPDGSVDLVFRPEGCRRKHTELLVAASSYVQPVGTFSGAVGGVEVDGLCGVTEDHAARW